jgi:hypothetical protein
MQVGSLNENNKGCTFLVQPLLMKNLLSGGNVTVE